MPSPSQAVALIERLVESQLRSPDVPGSAGHKDGAATIHFRFTGRVGGHTLRPGSYRLEATPRNTAGAGVVRKSFTVK